MHAIHGTDSSLMISGRYRELFGPLLLTGVSLEALRTWLSCPAADSPGGPGLDLNKGSVTI
jgi:hypothetical protein